MSFHGALIGIIIGTYLFSKKKNILFFFIRYNSLCSPIGIFFGRIANFINGELVGKTTNVSWGVIFPNYRYVAKTPFSII
jgi:phosphatidylglycerol:prolipoprotein diacylglycerol transferase